MKGERAPQALLGMTTPGRRYSKCINLKEAMKLTQSVTKVNVTKAIEVLVTVTGDGKQRGKQRPDATRSQSPWCYYVLM